MIAFNRFGRGEHKLLALHGWLGDEDTFKSLQMSLDPDVFECAWLAHRGYGRSAEVGGRYSMEEMAQDALDVADALDLKRFSVIGHSMGGKAAQLVAARAVGRAQKLICVTPVPADPVPLPPEARAMFEGAVSDPAARRAVIDVSTGGRLSAVWVNQFAAASVSRSKAAAFAAYFRSWADDDLSAAVADCKADTLVLVGAHDPVITEDFCKQGFGPRFSQLSVEVLENSGHYPMDEVPLAFGARVASFLSS